MLDVYFSKKMIHVAVNITPDETSKHQGLIFSPKDVFSKINDRAEDWFAEFFLAGQQYKLVCLQTEMGPVELARVFEKHFGIKCSMIISGIIAPFSLKPANLDSFWQGLTQNTEQFSESKEKKENFSYKPT
ncbi:MAG: hypothetical protein WCS89_01610 [Candidatus Paceibacterota bacterium]|jgi:hypothetical protein